METNKVRLGDICDILDNKRIPLSDNERQTRIKNKNIDELYPYYGATKQVGYIDDFIFDDELILLGEDGVLFYDKNKPKAYLIKGKSWVNNHAHVLKVKSDIAVQNFILYFLNKFNYHGYVTGSTRLKLNRTNMIKIPINLPPLQKQKQIANTLDKAKELIDLRKESLKKLDILSKSLFIDMFGDPILNNKKWKKSKIKNGVIKVKNDNPLKFPNKRYIYIDIGSLENKIIPKYNFILGENAPSRAKQITLFNDILVATVRPNLNNVAMVKTTYSDILSSTGFCILRADLEVFNPYYLFEVTKHPGFIKNLMSVAKGASYPAINNGDILDMIISIPKIELQNNFAKKIEKIEEQKALYEKQLQKLQENFDALLQKSFEVV